ncbi:DUF1236 domain-containing protein [Thioclava sp. BHET1]|nr:DUF1236 domain-containing protein [Thioclava sp. BHET1]
MEDTMLNKKILAVSAIALAAVPFAATSSQAATINATVVDQGTILAGPGTQYEVVSSMPVQSDVVVDGCLADHSWCRVDYNGASGWVRSSNLTVVENGQSYVMTQPQVTQRVETLHYSPKKVAGSATAGTVAGAVTGAAVGGPVGAAVGGVIGAVAGASTTTPDKQVTTYVTQNPVPPAQIQGSMQVGTVVPDTVTLTPVPQSQFSYIYMDGHPVLVNNQNRTVVRVIN